MTDTHELFLQNRQQLNLTGVLSVESFDEKEIWLNTKMGVLVLKGQGMHITHLDLTEGKLSVDGTIRTLDYREERGVKGGRVGKNLVERLLR